MFQGANLYGHDYQHDEVFSKSKKKKWRPKHHELAFGKANTRPPWYRNPSYGGESMLPAPTEGLRFERAVGGGGEAKKTTRGKVDYRQAKPGLLAHPTPGDDKNQNQRLFGSVPLRGPGGEDALVAAWTQQLVDQTALNAQTRWANGALHDGGEGRSLVVREVTNSTPQALYPMSVVTDSFRRHTEAKAIDARHQPKAAHAHVPPLRHSQRMYLPYSRTRSDFPGADGAKMESLAQAVGPGWWPGRGAKHDAKDAGLHHHRDRAQHASAAASSSSSSALFRVSRASTPPGFMQDAQTGAPIRRPGALPGP